MLRILELGWFIVFDLITSFQVSEEKIEKVTLLRGTVSAT